MLENRPVSWVSLIDRTIHLWQTTLDVCLLVLLSQQFRLIAIYSYISVSLFVLNPLT